MKEYTGVDLFNHLENNPDLQLRYLLNTINYGNNLIDIKKYNLPIVLSTSFSWKDTLEGYKYWENIFRNLIKECND
jgi:hypothetical protein